MKKLLLFGIAAVFALGLAACSSGSGEEAPAENQNAPANEQATPAEEEQTGMPNPWTECASLDEAAQKAGVGTFEITDNLGLDDIALMNPTYMAMEGIAEADFEGGAFDVCVRKGTFEGQELSGDYNEYTENWQIDVDGTTVECHGYEPERVAAFTWPGSDANYSVMFTGLGGENMAISPDQVATVVTNVK